MVEAARRVGAAGIPSLHLASWFCSSAATSLVQAAIATGGGGAVTTVAGPWVSELTHRLAPFCALAIDDDIVPDPAGLAALWLERVLEGRGPGLAPRTFLLGSHRWTDVDPVTGVKPGPAAVWIAGPCGRLSQSGPPVGMAELVHDPADPFPSGRHSDDHRPLIARADVLHWATPSLRRPLAWFGAARCHLVVEAPAPGCDVVVTLLYDQLDGSRVRLADAAVEVAPGRIEVDVALPPVAVEVPAGSRLHVEVTAARFPRFARSLPGADRWSAASAAPLTLRVGPGAGGLLHLPTVAWPPAPAVAVDEAEAEDGRPMARLVDDRTGVVTSVRPVPTAAGAPPWLHLHAAAVADIGAHLPWPADRISTGMSVGDPERAWVCAVGEAVERYCGNLVPAGLVRSSYGRLAERGIAAVDPGALALYSPAQYAAPGFPFQPFTADLQVRWVDGRSLCDGAPILVPASLVYVNYHVGPGANEPVTNFVNLAGIAAGPDRRSAEASAMEELIERDATIIWWYNGLPARPVEIDHPRLASMLSPLPEAGPGWGRAAGTDSGWRYRVVALPTTLDVAVMGVLVHDPDLAIFGFGVAARPDPAEAVRKAFAEAVSLHLYANGLLDPDGDIWQLVRSGTIDGAVLKPHRPDRQYLDDYRDDWRDVVDLACHSQVWLDPRLHHALGPIVDDAPVVTLDDLPHLAGDTWTAYRDRLVGRGLQPYSVDVTTPDVAAAGAGAVRVVAPGAYSNPPAAFPLLGGHRLYQDPVVLGLRSAPLAEGGIRRVPLPHT